jgi:hypothetical protein
MSRVASTGATVSLPITEKRTTQTIAMQQIAQHFLLQLMLYFDSGRMGMTQPQPPTAMSGCRPSDLGCRSVVGVIVVNCIGETSGLVLWSARSRNRFRLRRLGS